MMVLVWGVAGFGRGKEVRWMMMWRGQRRGVDLGLFKTVKGFGWAKGLSGLRVFVLGGLE